MMKMKRSRDEFDALTTVANYLMLFSSPTTTTLPAANEKMFECKTCNRRFSSFQALGGHRASHKKPRLLSVDSDNNSCISGEEKPKKTSHECSICGVEFKLGQALGGHMRRHRPLLSAQSTMLSLSAVSSPPKKLVSKAPEKELRVNDDALCLDLTLSL